MKYTGAALLWTAFTLAGIKISLLLKNRISVLDETIVFLNSLITEIKFSKIDLKKMFSAFSVEPSMKKLQFLNNFSSEIDCMDFHNIWDGAIKSFPYYKREEKDKMLQLGAFLGTTDANNQINIISLYLSFFENYRNSAVNEYEKYGKISSLFGLYAGASIFILLL